MTGLSYTQLIEYCLNSIKSNTISGHLTLNILLTIIIQGLLDNLETVLCLEEYLKTVYWCYNKEILKIPFCSQSFYFC